MADGRNADTDTRQVRLYCSKCNEVHTFTRGKVERIVYALLGAASDMVDHDHIQEWVRSVRDSEWDAFADVFCLVDIYASSNDSEEYGEWTDEFVAMRKGIENDRQRVPVTSNDGDDA